MHTGNRDMRVPPPFNYDFVCVDQGWFACTYLYMYILCEREREGESAGACLCVLVPTRIRHTWQTEWLLMHVVFSPFPSHHPTSPLSSAVYKLPQVQFAWGLVVKTGLTTRPAWASDNTCTTSLWGCISLHAQLTTGVRTDRSTWTTVSKSTTAVNSTT